MSMPIEKNMFLIPKCVAYLMDNIEGKRAMELRLVCKLWNDEVIASLRRKPPKNLFRSICIEYSDTGNNSNKTIPSFFDDSEIMDLLLSDFCVRLTDYKEEEDNNLNDTQNGTVFEIQANENDETLLIKYGMHAKNLYVAKDLSSGRLNRYLKELCPNLKDLEMNNSILPINNNYFDFLENTTLNIDRFSAYLYLEDNDKLVQSFSTMQRHVQVFTTIIKASPKLKSLQLEVPALELYIAHLQLSPEVMTNLMEFYLTGNVLENLHEINKLRFSSNLKKLKFSNEGIIEPTEKNSIIHELLTFLQTNGFSLEYLVINNWTEYKHRDSDRDEISLSDIGIDALPEMPALKKLSSFFTFPSFKFIKKMPNLDSLRLNKTINSDTLYSEPIPLNKISDLTLHHSPSVFEVLHRFPPIPFDRIKTPEMIRSRNEAFPMLKAFYLELFPPQWLGKEELSKWFADICEEISKMANIQRLALSLSLTQPNELTKVLEEEGPETLWYPEVNLDSGFNFLKNIPNLEILVLGQRFPNEYTTFPRKVLLKLLEAPKLKELGLFGLNVEAMDNSDVAKVAEAKDFFQKFSESCVTLKHKVDMSKWTEYREFFIFNIVSEFD